MENYRAVIQLYYLDAKSGKQIRESDTVVTFTAESEGIARVAFRELTRQCLLKKGQPKDVHFRSYLYCGNEMRHEMYGSSPDSLTPESTLVAESFFRYKELHPDPVPEDLLTPLQKRMQSGDPGHVSKTDPK